MPSHVYHDGLPNYDERAVYQDGCPVCETRAKKELGGILDLDVVKAEKLWKLMVAMRGPERVREPDIRHRSVADATATAKLYSVAVLMERAGLNPWTDFYSIKVHPLRDLIAGG